MYGAVLVPTDGSPAAEGPIARAFDLARTGDATLHVLHVVDAGPEPPALESTEWEALRRRSEERGRAAADRIRDRATGHGLAAARAVREGVPYREIVAYADETDVDLIVMGTHGRSGAERSRLGSTTERVVTLADVPVMTVRLGDDGADVPESGRGAYDRVVVPTDGSDAAHRAADHGLAVAERYGADVHAVSVVEGIDGLGDVPRSIVGLLRGDGEHATADVAAAARERDLPVTTEVLRGVPHEAVRSYAADVDADLVAMGTRGRTTTNDRLLGGTTARVVRRSEVPVLTVP